MSINPKCKICGKTLDRKTAYKIISNGKNLYYCNEKEYADWKSKKDNEEKLIEQIMFVVTQTLNIEFSDLVYNNIKSMISSLKQLYSLEQIFQYVNNESERISDILSKKDFKNCYNMIRYYIAVVKNNIGDYIFESKDDINSQIKIVEDFYMAPILKYKSSKVRRSGIDIEKLGDEDE